MELDVRGTPGWQISEYLRSLGGIEKADGTFAGRGWSAVLTVGQFRTMGTSVPRVLIQLDGEAGAVSTVASALRLRVMRVGG